LNSIKDGILGNMNEWEMGMPFDDRSEEIILAEMTGFK
jgi:hypothetical protein